MTQIKTAVFVGCMLGIAFFMLKNILPDKNIYKSVKITMSLVMLVTMISLLTKIEFNFSFEEITAQANALEKETLENYNENYVAEIEKTAEKNLMLYFNKNNISYKDVVIETFLDEYNCLEVERVKIFVGENDKISAIELVKELLGEEIILEIETYGEN